MVGRNYILAVTFYEDGAGHCIVEVKLRDRGEYKVWMADLDEGFECWGLK